MSPRADSTPGAVEVVLSAEQLSVEVERVPAERVRISKRIVEELRTVQVPLRREELVITREPLSSSGPLSRTAPAEELVLVLHEEVPVVSVTTQAYERVTVSVETVHGEEVLRTKLRTEHASVTVSEEPGALHRS
ncbi:YsnF/AvaK domain-containing protein [Kineococcus rubinsiae]|uniref:YsnF/AvaK domain-containing protein n=1 Tax=Kineococcus rubinsiae TaxID=2609562 RepID=UPI00143054EC|nr:DUF2382 domain-containing protein [Kineococcus rubinsiae]NIZ89538.1 DUF2382 domain-containing protein [Kineococcus rubinsiae]